MRPLGLYRSLPVYLLLTTCAGPRGVSAPQLHSLFLPPPPARKRAQKQMVRVVAKSSVSANLCGITRKYPHNALQEAKEGRTGGSPLEAFLTNSTRGDTRLFPSFAPCVPHVAPFALFWGSYVTDLAKIASKPERPERAVDRKQRPNPTRAAIAYLEVDPPGQWGSSCGPRSIFWRASHDVIACAARSTDPGGVLRLGALAWEPLKEKRRESQRP